MATASDLINRALRLIGVVASGETPSAADTNDALTTLNTMLDSWTNERLTCYATQEDTFNLTSGTGTYTIGSGATFNMTRPVKIESAYVNDSQDNSYPLVQIDADAWGKIGTKTSGATFPSYFWYETSFANGVIHLWPEPGSGVTITLQTRQPFTSFATTGTTVSLPPGYERAIIYSLAIEIAPEYGISITPEIAAVNAKAKYDLKRVNATAPISQVETGYMSPQNRFSIYRG